MPELRIPVVGRTVRTGTCNLFCVCLSGVSVPVICVGLVYFQCIVISFYTFCLVNNVYWHNFDIVYLPGLLCTGTFGVRFRLQ